MKFKVEFEAETASHDADVMAMVPDAIRSRFDGTAVHVGKIVVTQEPYPELPSVKLGKAGLPTEKELVEMPQHEFEEYRKKHFFSGPREV